MPCLSEHAWFVWTSETTVLACVHCATSDKTKGLHDALIFIFKSQKKYLGDIT